MPWWPGQQPRSQLCRAPVRGPAEHHEGRGSNGVQAQHQDPSSHEAQGPGAIFLRDISSKEIHRVWIYLVILVELIILAF